MESWTYVSFMEKDKILEEIKPICLESFEDQNLIIDYESSPETIDKWDSLHHVVLIDKIEKHFNIEFELDDMLEMNNIGDICLKVAEKLK